jgi:hypothetical protein
MTSITREDSLCVVDRKVHEGAAVTNLSFHLIQIYLSIYSSFDNPLVLSFAICSVLPPDHLTVKLPS